MALLTINHYINQVNNFITNVRDTRHAYYVFAGRSNPWPSDSNPPAANDSVAQYQQTVYDDLLFGKLVRSGDVINMIPRYNWTTGTVYSQYDPNDPDLYTKQFFVVTDQFQVYKCVFNSYGAPSTVKPTLISPAGSFKAADGYIWKYMYTIDSTSNTKFTTTSYIPAIQNANVQSNAVPGTIEAIQITNGGSNYQVYEKGNIVKFIDAFTIQLPNTSSAYDNFYAKSSIYLKAGFGAGQIRQIASSSGGAKTVRVSSSTPFQTFARLDLSSISGTVSTGYTVQQPVDYINYLYPAGYFNVGDTIVQANTGVTGTILTANSSTIQVARSSLTTPFSLYYPLIDSVSSGSLQSGTVNISSGGNTVVSTNTAQTSFTTSYAVGSFIRVGTNANTNVRRVTAVNTSTVNVNIAFDNTLLANVYYTVPVAAEPTSITVTQANGSVVNTNLTSLNLSISNSSIVGQYFIAGELVDLVSAANITQGANAIVAYANTSQVFLTAVNGTNWSNTYFWANNFYVKGESSQIRYLLNSATSNPNITINNNSGSFILGQKANFLLNGAVTGNATVIGTMVLPNDSTEYELGPTVLISGDGSNAAGLGVVNNSFGSANNITSVEMINTGTNYTFANVSFVANGVYGSGAAATPLISPVHGHGFDVMTELGARYAGVDVTFDTGPNESYYFPTYGTYRRIGLLEDPQFADVRVTLGSFDRVNAVLSNYVIGSLGSWTPGEVVVQSTSNAAGIVVSGNSTALQLKSVKGTFANNTAYTLRGYYSGTTANTVTANVIYFSPGVTAEVVSEVTSGANAIVTAAYSNTQLQLSNVVGQFVSGDTLYDSSSNAYAVITDISIANGTTDQVSTFGLKFNQTARITLTSSSGTFTNNEFVQQDFTSANARIVSTSNDLDLTITSMSGSFSNGQTLTDQTTGANGVVIFANSSYVKLTSVNQSLAFVAGHTINNGSSSTAVVSQVLPVLVLNDINGANRFQAQPNNIVGQTSGAIGQVNSYSLITYPQLVRESGKVVYMENIQPVTRTAVNKEEFKLVIQF